MRMTKVYHIMTKGGSGSLNSGQYLALNIFPNLWCRVAPPPESRDLLLEQGMFTE